MDVMVKSKNKCHHDAQTVLKNNKEQQTSYDTSTQTTEFELTVKSSDKIILPQKYTTADEREATILEKVIILQSYWRRWLATRLVHNLRKDKNDILQWNSKIEEKKSKDRTDRLVNELKQCMNPKTKADFELLYAVIEKWRKDEVLRINISMCGPERKAALISLYEQEFYLIQSVENQRLKCQQNKENKRLTQVFLEASQPKNTNNKYNDKIFTQAVYEAEEILKIFNSLQLNYFTVDERLDLLSYVKQKVKNSNKKSRLGEELLILIQREEEFSARNFPATSLKGLRDRTAMLFLEYCKSNEAAKPEKKERPPIEGQTLKLHQSLFFCPSCNSYLSSDEFPLMLDLKLATKCNGCVQLDNKARLRKDYSRVKLILQQIRLSEKSYNDNSRISQLIQEKDLQHVIEMIWNSKSVLSGSSDLCDMVLVRWNKYTEWSPWNCVMLTTNEGDAHLKHESMEEAYGPSLIESIHHRHVIAKKYFSNLVDFF